jgi:two-component system, OmpR family, alkaline phosphatase synthesis response regulator PhoP
MDAPTILLADDEAHITCIVSQKLRSAGFSVVVARDGEEAFDLACRVRPALVVTDLQMPRMSGLELAIKLKQTEATATTPVVMLTARGYIIDQAAMDQTNIRHVMAKPFSAQAILRKTTELVGVPGGCGTVEAA